MVFLLHCICLTGWEDWDSSLLTNADLWEVPVQTGTFWGLEAVNWCKQEGLLELLKRFRKTLLISVSSRLPEVLSILLGFKAKENKFENSVVCLKCLQCLEQSWFSYCNLNWPCFFDQELLLLGCHICRTCSLRQVVVFARKIYLWHRIWWAWESTALL